MTAERTVKWGDSPDEQMVLRTTQDPAGYAIIDAENGFFYTGMVLDNGCPHMDDDRWHAVWFKTEKEAEDYIKKLVKDNRTSRKGRR